MCYLAVGIPLLAFQHTEIERDPYQPQMISEDGSWCWFQDDRAILKGNKVLFSGVTSTGNNTITEWDLNTHLTQTTQLTSGSLPADDHNVGALMIRPDGKILTVYAGHSIDSLVRYRVSASAGSIEAWQEEKQFKTNGRVCYSNVYRLEDSGMTYNFFRGNESNPHFLVSSDDGDSWKFGGRLFEFRGRSYLRYASDGEKRIHFITTDGHPRHFNNNIYHGYIENDQVYRSDGTLVGPLSSTTKSNFKPSDFTLVYNGDLATRTDVAWTSDIKLDQDGLPYIVFSVTKDPITRGETQNTSLGGNDHRYHYAQWDGEKWEEDEIAFAGSRLYPGENEYTGLISLHPKNKNVLYFSTDVDPQSGSPILVDGERRYEIFRAERLRSGAPWHFTPVTYHSISDNIRPIVLADDQKEVVLWLSGRYTTYRDYQLKVYGKVMPTGLVHKVKSPKKILFLTSKDSNNYEAHWTIPAFAAKLMKESGHQTQVIIGEGERQAFHLPGLEAIKDADLVVTFLRRVALSNQQMDLIQQHLKSGKPLVGIRTANHAFSVMDQNIPAGFEDWWEFVPEILGHENQGYGPSTEETKVILKSNSKQLLKNIPEDPWFSNGNIYLIHPTLDKKSKVWLEGQSAGYVEPIAWTRKANKSKIFYTSLGYPTDFQHPNFLRLLNNAINWSLD
ncbi:MAG: BNR-4 repeat-containing protein [Cyclobacteriaceae bacterium]